MKSPNGLGWRSAWPFVFVACFGGILAVSYDWRHPLNLGGLDASERWLADVSSTAQTQAGPQIDRPSALNGPGESITNPIRAITSLPAMRVPDHLDADPPLASSHDFTSAWLTSKSESALNQSSPPYSPMGWQVDRFGSNPAATTVGSAATWIGPSGGSWNEPTFWDPTTVPNGAGNLADFKPSVANATAMVTIMDVPGGATLGTLTLGGSAAQGWTVSLSAPLIMDNNGTGAVISNINPATGSYRLLVSGSQSLVLADNLSIINSGGSTSVDGSINVTAKITGTGNLTISNLSNNIAAGQILIGGPAPSNFFGSTTITGGAVVFQGNSAFGVAGNQIILGSSGGGSVSLIGLGGSSNLQNPIIVAGGTGGTTTLGSTFPSPFSTSLFSGSLVLNGNVSLFNDSTFNSLIFLNTISGVGGITKIGMGDTFLSGNNSFTGATIIDQGLLQVTSTNALGGTASITVNSGGTLLFSGASTNRINDHAEIILNGNGSVGAQLFTNGNSEHGLTNNEPGMGSVTLQSSSIIDLAAGASIIAFDNSSGQTWNSLSTLSIYNWSGTPITGNGTDQLYIGSDITGLTALQLQQIIFYSDDGFTFLGKGGWGTDLDGEVVPILVPEPATWVGAALALAAVGITRWRKKITG
jgi:autotransporter-associated beta strand protein